MRTKYRGTIDQACRYGHCIDWRICTVETIRLFDLINNDTEPSAFGNRRYGEVVGVLHRGTALRIYRYHICDQDGFKSHKHMCVYVCKFDLTWCLSSAVYYVELSLFVRMPYAWRISVSWNWKWIQAPIKEQTHTHTHLYLLCGRWCAQSDPHKPNFDIYIRVCSASIACLTYTLDDVGCWWEKCIVEFWEKELVNIVCATYTI